VCRRLLAPALLPLLLVSCDAVGPPARGHRAAFPGLHTRLVLTQATTLVADDLHAHLSEALVGEALTRGFLRSAAAGRRRQTEGATVRIEDVRYEDVQIIARGPEGSELQASWIVSGTVRHGDHAHRRATRYAGRYLVVDTPHGPRIAEERGGDATRLPAPPPASDGGASALDLLGAPP
jgi:hypothetical protein